MPSITDQFRGMPVEDLIAAPLTAVCVANLRLAQATTDFIRVVGFQPPTIAAGATPDPDAVGAPRKVSFQFTRALPGDATATPAIPASVETVNLDVSPLSIVNIPALQIKTVDIVFDMEVKSATTAKESTDTSISGSLDVTAKWSAVKVAVHVQGSVATHRENTRTTDNSAKYHFELHAADSGMPEGLSRVLDIMQAAIAPVPVKPASATP